MAFNFAPLLRAAYARCARVLFSLFHTVILRARRLFGALHVRAYGRRPAGMSSSSLGLPTAEELLDRLAHLEGLKQEMRRRSAGGADRSGRYRKVDTARLSFINTVAIPDLALGKVPSRADWDMLFGPHDDDLSGPAKRDAYAWADAHYRDVRSQAQLPELSSARQRTLLEWVEKHPAAFSKPVDAPRGAPAVYRFDFGVFRDKGLTVADLARDGTARGLFSGQSVGGGPYLHWVAGSTFAWRFPGHMQLYLALLRLKQTPVSRDRAAPVALDLTVARAAYRDYAGAQLVPPRAAAGSRSPRPLPSRVCVRAQPPRLHTSPML